MAANAEHTKQVEGIQSVNELKEHNIDSPLLTKHHDSDEAVALQATMASFSDPDSYDLADTRSWLVRPTMGNRVLIGADSDVWEHGTDLFALRKRHTEDPFSRWVIDKLLIWLHHHVLSRFKGSSRRTDPETGVAMYNDETLLAYTSLVSSVLAAILPVAAITVLFCVSNMAIRLGLIALFSLIFSLCLTRFTTAKKSEMFGATAA